MPPRQAVNKKYSNKIHMINFLHHKRIPDIIRYHSSVLTLVNIAASDMCVGFFFLNFSMQFMCVYLCQFPAPTSNYQCEFFSFQYRCDPTLWFAQDAMHNTCPISTARSRIVQQTRVRKWQNTS